MPEAVDAADEPLAVAPLSIGRSRSCSIVVDAPTVSRHHADLTELGPDTYRFEDRGSSGGSYRVENGAWRRFVSAELGLDERIRMGDFECTLDELLSQIRQAETLPAQTVIERDPATGQIVVRRL